MRLMRVFVTKTSQGHRVSSEHKSAEGRRVKRVVGTAKTRGELVSSARELAVSDKVIQ